MRFEDFQDGQNYFSNSELYVTLMPPIKYGLNGFEEFQDGSHLGCRNGTNLAVLNLHVSPMSPTKFQLNPTYLSRADVVSRFSSWPPWQPFWILELNQFSNSKPLCHTKCLPSRLDSIQLTVLEQTWFGDFQDGHCGGNLG